MPVLALKPADREDKWRTLARELARNIRDADEVLSDYGLTLADYESLQQDNRFAAVLRQEVAEWESVTNTRERVSLKLAAMAEEGLPALHRRMTDPKEPLSGVASLFASVLKGAKIGDTPIDQGKKGAVFKLSINLGVVGEAHGITLEGNALDLTALPNPVSDLSVNDDLMTEGCDD